MSANNTIASTTTAVMTYREYITGIFEAVLMEMGFEGGAPNDWYNLEENDTVWMYQQVNYRWPDQYLPPMVNTTPHAIHIRPKPGVEVVFAPSAILTRVEVEQEVLNSHFNLTRRAVTGVAGIPAKIDSHHLHVLVSSMVLDAVELQDGITFYAPDTGAGAIRNHQGLIVAVTGLITK